MLPLNLDYSSHFPRLRPTTTLFLLSSVDGKISTGVGMRDFDLDLPNIAGAKEGLQQYYDIEQTTDTFTLSSGVVQAKVGRNLRPLGHKVPVTIVVFDSSHLTLDGVNNLCSSYDNVILFTSSNKHPGYGAKRDNICIYPINDRSLLDDLSILYYRHDCRNLTIQSGGTLSSSLLRNNLIDYIDIVVAPILVGGSDTPTILDGYNLTTVSDLAKVKTLNLLEVSTLDNNYIRLKYEVKL